MTTSLHAHVYSESSSCDGLHARDYVISLNDEEIAEHVKEDGGNDFHDLHFKERVLGGIASFHAESRITVNESGFFYVEPTEEGWVHVEVTWCEDANCDPNTSSRYDQYAEMMGY